MQELTFDEVEAVSGGIPLVAGLGAAAGPIGLAVVGVVAVGALAVGIYNGYVDEQIQAKIRSQAK